ncbi:secreted protein [Candidatus Magnetobacterium bavaricum]|uniref:Secreted protein n=1 Tax=Candidatus Magnetobacterium bavaricum TaxID=29290 RepID=A0A0F3GUP0_9BACT|nr:secreted protein [Candidatus Magnetobacterium bavaricum]
MKETLTCLLCLLLLLVAALYKDTATADDEELRQLINSVRAEIKHRPAVIEDLPRRVFLLNRWAWMLFEQGMDVNKVYPWQKAIDIDRVSKVNPQEAVTTVAAAYADLERFVAAAKDNPVKNKRQRDININEINKTRQELKTTPTNVTNLKHRIDCLNNWARLLMSQGLGAGRIYTFETAMMLTSYVETQPDAALQLTDSLFAALEAIQASPVITSPSPHWGLS